MTSRSIAAAQYVRMSTDLQDLSIELQKRAIARFADSTGLTIIKTYEDAGKSGLSIRQRTAMQALVKDVADPSCPFSRVLVYDVSRWGRFQNTDAAAYWEYHCELHGVQVVYVAEAFEHHQGPLGVLIKNLKRAMAAEYSRELAVKVRAGQHRVIEMGFSAGGNPPLGLVRQVVTREGFVRGILNHGERKGIQSDRIKLVPGPAKDVELVQRIFSIYANTELSIEKLCIRLKAEGVITARGTPFTDNSLHRLLRYEGFIGNYIWGRRASAATGGARVSPKDLVRRNAAIDPIIDRQTWDRVQAKLSNRRRPDRTRQELLQGLRTALVIKPDLSGADMGALGCAQSQTYLKAFGSMEVAYALAGRDSSPELIRRSRERAEQAKRITREIQCRLANAIEVKGVRIQKNLQAHALIFPNGYRVQVFLSWKRSFTREPAWTIPRIRRSASNLRLLFLMKDDRQIHSIFLVPDEERFTVPIIFRDKDLPILAHAEVKTFEEAGDCLIRRSNASGAASS